MAAATIIAPVNAVANPQSPTILLDQHKNTIQQLDARAALHRQLCAAMVPLISQAVRRMTLEWPNEAIEWRLSGAEVSEETYDVINRFGGLLPPCETLYGCIFFTFRLRQQPHTSRTPRQRTSASSLFIENVQLTGVLRGV